MFAPERMHATINKQSTSKLINLTSMGGQNECFSQASAIRILMSGSNGPNTVVPAVAITTMVHIPGEEGVEEKRRKE